MPDSYVTTPAPSGQQWLLRKGSQQATVVEIGGAVRDYLVDDLPVLDGFAVDTMATGARGTTLAPWPNRLRDGRYRFNGSDHQLALSEPGKGNAMHGLVRWRPWALVDRAEDRLSIDVTLLPQPGYPFFLHLRNDYLLDDAGLTVSTTATNLGEDPLPYGLGFHPYLSAGGGLVDDFVLTVPARQWLPVDERLLPTGVAPVEGTDWDFRTGRVIGSRVIDIAYTDLVRDHAGRATVFACQCRRDPYRRDVVPGAV